VKRRLRIATAVVVALALLGANGVAAAGAGAADQTDYRTKVVRDADVSVSYPRTWTPVPVTARELERTRKRLAVDNPELMKRLDETAQEQFVQAAKFRVADLTTNTYRPSLTVATLDMPFPSPPEFSILREQFGQMGFGVMDVSRPKFGHQRGYRIDLARSFASPDGSLVPLRLTEFFVPGGDGTALVVAAAQDTPEGQALIRDLMNRIRPG
jgi:hypothetical protein